MKIRKKQTYTVVKFEAGMEDGEMYSNIHGNRYKYKILPSGGYKFITNEDDCYIIRNDFNGSLELVGKKHIDKHYDILEGDK